MEFDQDMNRAAWTAFNQELALAIQAGKLDLNEVPRVESPDDLVLRMTRGTGPDRFFLGVVDDWSAFEIIDLGLGKVIRERFEVRPNGPHTRERIRVGGIQGYPETYVVEQGADHWSWLHPRWRWPFDE